MQHVIIVIHLMVVAALVALVLYQKSEGGALGIGSSGFLTGRGQANALTRATGILGTIFFLTSLALTVLPAWQRGPGERGDWTKAIDQGNIQLKEIPAPAPGAPDAAKDGKESIFEQLQRAQEQRQKAGAPAAPPAEAPKSIESSKPAPAPKGAEAPRPAESAKPAEPAKPAESKPVESKPVEAPKAQAPSAPPSAEAEKPALRPSVVEPVKPAPATEAAPAGSEPRAFAPSWLRSTEPQSQTPATAKEPAKSSAPGAGESKEKPAAPPPTIWKSPAQ
jgi:protein translocase SecG subunit